MTFLSASGLLKSLVAEADADLAIRDVSLTVREGESVAVGGPRGSGKSTLAHS